MLISPSKCPICQKMTVYLGACTNCWWVKPSRLRCQADSFELFKNFIIAEREGRVIEEKHGDFTLKKIIHNSEESRLLGDSQ